MGVVLNYKNENFRFWFGFPTNRYVLIKYEKQSRALLFTLQY